MLHLGELCREGVNRHLCRCRDGCETPELNCTRFIPNFQGLLAILWSVNDLIWWDTAKGFRSYGGLTSAVRLSHTYRL